MFFSLPTSLEEVPRLGRNHPNLPCASEKLQRANLLRPAKQVLISSDTSLVRLSARTTALDHPSSPSDQVVNQDDRSYHQQEMDQASAAAHPEAEP
jgi:hypothetical protein